MCLQTSTCLYATEQRDSRLSPVHRVFSRMWNCYGHTTFKELVVSGNAVREFAWQAGVGQRGVPEQCAVFGWLGRREEAKGGLAISSTNSHSQHTSWEGVGGCQSQHKRWGGDLAGGSVKGVHTDPRMLEWRETRILGISLSTANAEWRQESVKERLGRSGKAHAHLGSEPRGLSIKRSSPARQSMLCIHNLASTSATAALIYCLTDAAAACYKDLCLSEAAREPLLHAHGAVSYLQRPQRPTGLRSGE
ncbi:hypothetical protein PR048_023464 [Dryococelus australis]|uniref:Uncharacterized protein n=1 Tax=Dryococelus australis TaxID=614101 RepID=A0ABQ9GU92_9NEOP|nr:hypothetical protein PR048_023464 [Dryococelus australis]